MNERAEFELKSILETRTHPAIDWVPGLSKSSGTGLEGLRISQKNATQRFPCCQQTIIQLIYQAQDGGSSINDNNILVSRFIFSMCSINQKTWSSHLQLVKTETNRMAVNWSRLQPPAKPSHSSKAKGRSQIPDRIAFGHFPSRHCQQDICSVPVPTSTLPLHRGLSVFCETPEPHLRRRDWMIRRVPEQRGWCAIRGTGRNLSATARDARRDEPVLRQVDLTNWPKQRQRTACAWRLVLQNNEHGNINHEPHTGRPERDCEIENRFIFKNCHYVCRFNKQFMQANRLCKHLCLGMGAISEFYINPLPPSAFPPDGGTGND